MKLNVEVTLAGADAYQVACGPKAISAAEKHYNVLVSEGRLAVENLAYMAWAQSVTDQQFVGPWSEFWDKLDDLDVVEGRTDPTG